MRPCPSDYLCRNPSEFLHITSSIKRQPVVAVAPVERPSSTGPDSSCLQDCDRSAARWGIPPHSPAPPGRCFTEGLWFPVRYSTGFPFWHCSGHMILDICVVFHRVSVLPRYVGTPRPTHRLPGRHFTVFMWFPSESISTQHGDRGYHSFIAARSEDTSTVGAQRDGSLVILPGSIRV